MSKFDVIIVGAGSAGSVLTATLVEAGARVLLLEAGGAAQAYPRIWDPNAKNCLSQIPEIDWHYESTPQGSLGRRVLALRRAKVTGGCTAHNDMVYARGARGDYDSWARDEGCRGWSYQDVVPFFESVEACLQPSTTFVNDFGSDFIDACVDLGLPVNPDYNSGASMRGVSLMRSTIAYSDGYEDPRRVTSFERYVKPLLGRPNLEVRRHVLVSRVLFESPDRATGIEFVEDSQIRTASSAETVLCAGAYNSPKILLLSGVGDPKHLAKHGIPVTFEQPQVGRNLQDALIFKALWTTSRPIENQPANLGCAIVWDNMEDNDQPKTCLEMMRGLYSCEQTQEELKMHYGVTGGAMRLKSKGYVALRSSDPADPPVIDPCFLTARGDYEQCVAAYELMLKVGNSEGLASWRRDQINPKPGEDIHAWLQKSIYPYSHPVGTCAMGASAEAVVDPESLKIKGLEGLRIADVSIMPRITSAHTQGPAFMIGAKAASLLT